MPSLRPDVQSPLLCRYCSPPRRPASTPMPRFVPTPIFPQAPPRPPPSTVLESPHIHGNFRMATEDSKDMLKNADWKTVSDAVTESSQPVVRKRLPKKIRQVPECYFLPRRSLPSALAIYGAVCAAGVGAGMLLEVWINKKIKEDGGIVWEVGK
ncbi:hypothetical protein ZWY2020_054966 [Hordeum vulgare]|nr:hypothetical protein ZWY2020_054966 [Hordeum vulgare]